ncbi:DNA polymerase III subunit delta [Bordetella pertussis]|uniref:DNA polymerase III subunit delta n=1 Tax=Bordetella pertussis TaxID=520 RepID=UPI0021627F0F|nr:DNA polymerase III subunit delta [Bordetella pertussis]
MALPRLDKATRESKWAQALARGGVMADIANVERGRLPAWIGMRLGRQNQRADTATLQWMADKVEGNLLAAHQEIQKLGLLYPEGQLAAEDVERAVLTWRATTSSGCATPCWPATRRARCACSTACGAEGEALPLVLWAVGEEIRLLARVAQARQQGQDAGALMRRLRIFGAHERLALQALGRVAPGAWPAAVQHAHEVDRLIKGLSVPGRLADPWGRNDPARAARGRGRRPTVKAAWPPPPSRRPARPAHRSG